MKLSRRALLVSGFASLTLATGCVGSGSYRTYYAEPIAPDVSRGWRVVDVRVAVPESLTVSEAATLVPRADIVWREDPAGDRRAQVATIMRAAIKRGASGLRGPRGVYLDVTMTRFHALTFEAETRLSNAGVHNIDFVATIVDAASGATLAGPVEIEASLPALSGDQMRAARARGETQKSQISAHVARVIAGWLGTGPDLRRNFTRSGD
ncbi:MAG: hypothetical protein HC844_16020 [Tabrizicola sp.]|nr:hypothetical protein [Tabrizicola sp.]